MFLEASLMLFVSFCWLVKSKAILLLVLNCRCGRSIPYCQLSLADQQVFGGGAGSLDGA